MRRELIGVVLAGGAGRRVGGAKATLTVAGRPLISYPMSALASVCDRVAVVTKPSVSIPAFDGVERWNEPERPRHPLTGLVYALERAGEPVLVCAADMPFVTPEACRMLLGGEGDAVVAEAGGRLQPLLGVYSPAVLGRLREAPPDARLTATVAGLEPIRVALPAAVVAGVNTPDDLALAEAKLAGG